MDSREEIINNVLSSPFNGGVPTSYQVHFTAERVMLIFGVVPKTHKDELEALILRETDSSWVNSPELASMVGARLAIGLPELIEQLKARLNEALSQSGNGGT